MEENKPSPHLQSIEHAISARLPFRSAAAPPPLVTVFDCIGANLAKLDIPPGVKMAGYTTGAGDVPWTPAQFEQHPDAIRIDQSPTDTQADELADVFDCEPGAGRLAGLVQWVRAARAGYIAAARPGQRSPVTYMSKDTVTPVVNALNAGGISSGVGLWIAEQMEPAQAAHLVTTASGPFPIVGIQFAFLGDHDVSVFNLNWLNAVSRKPPAIKSQPGEQGGWLFCSKCKSLFFGPQEQQSYCSAGGQHDGSHSHNYSIPFIA